MLLIGRTLDQEKEEAAEAVGKTDGKIDQRVSVFGFEGMMLE